MQYRLRRTSLLSGLLAASTLAACAADVEKPTGTPASSGRDTSGAALPETTPPASPPPASPPPAKTATPTPTPSGPVTFKVLSYNVAGLPQGVSKSNPNVNTKLISPKLNAYDVVVVQEDFTYHADLVSASTHPHKSAPMPSNIGGMNDGLNVLSHIPYGGFARTKWTSCNGFIDNGNDCLAPKGFARFVLELGTGLEVDFYDVHFDASRSQGDYEARDAQVTQLAAVIASESAGRAVIVAGDTNMKIGDEPVFQRLLSAAGLSCACRTLSCAEPERIDRVLYKSSSTVTITPKSHAVLDWVTDAGEPLSDHEPVLVELEAKL